ncbi:MAG: bi-domain-containing oxidoreductase [Flavobacteriales bacterium]
MRKLVQDLEKGRMRLMEVPEPKPGPGELLVKTHHSVISPGTEGKTVSDARKGYWAKARARQDEVKKLIRTAREKGIRDTYRIVKDRLQVPSSLGYSCCGEVMEVGPNVADIRAGERVACAGKKAEHAEWVCVPRMLCVPIPETLSSEEAAFTTLGAIAMQGIRRAELGIGASGLVIGGGIIGVISARILQAGGMKPILIEQDPERVAFARNIGIEHAFERSREDIEERIHHLTQGKGADAALITAATPPSDPVELAGRACRHRGIVVMVGDAATGFERRNYYQKELELRMSKAYGPGRHDRNYEEKGLDHPIGQVRWTEGRNMEAIIELLASGKLEFASLISQRYPFEEAHQAYEEMLQGDGVSMGILLEYAAERRKPEYTHRRAGKERVSGKARIGLIGGGSFARSILLPALPPGMEPSHVVTRNPAVARYLGEQYGAQRWSSDPEAAIEDDELDALIIATRHDSHGELVEQGLRAGKNVFVEKPLCIREEEIEAIRKAYEAGTGTLMVGFNRRFAPLFHRLMSELNPSVPKSIRIHVNAGVLSSEHWVHDPEVGGGRILGELCHFIDLVAAIAGSPIEGIEGNALPAPNGKADTVVCSMHAADGSIATLSYSSDGAHGQAKERIEVDQHGRTLQLEDFKKVRVLGASSREKRSKQDKGHAEEFRCWTDSLKKGNEAPIPFEQLLNSTWASFALKKSVEGRAEENGAE